MLNPCKAKASLWPRVLHLSWLLVAAHGVVYDDEVLHVGMMMPLIGTGADGTLATTVYSELEFRKYMDEPVHDFRRSDGSLIGHYSPIPNIHPNLTRLRVHLKDTRYSPKRAATYSVEFAYGSEAENVPPMNAVVGPVIDQPTISSANILGVFGMVQVSSGGLAQELTDKTSYPYLFRMGSSNSVFGVAMWDYLEYFGWRGAHMLYEDNDFGNSLRIGLSEKAEAQRRSGDVTYFILPEIQFVDLHGLEDKVVAAEVAVSNAAQQMLSSFHRLIFVAIWNADGLGVIINRKLKEADVTAPYFQIGVPPNPMLVMRTVQYFEGHAPETFHGFMATTDLSQPSIEVFRESWMTLSGDVIMNRLPALGLDPSKDIIGYTVEDVDRLFKSWPPPWFTGSLPIHAAFNTVLRAFNAMLNDGYRPPEIQGDKLREYMRDVNYYGFGTHVQFNENQDVIKDISISCAVGFDASNWTIWRDVAFRKPPGSDGAAIVEPAPGSVGLFWATGERGWTPPQSLRACPLGATFHPDAAGDMSRNSTVEPLIGTCELCVAGRFSATYNSNRCDACPGGTISEEPGSSECTTCPIGYFALEGSPVCTACFAGSYGEKAGASACNSCLPGSFQNETGKLVCKECPAGEHALTIRSERCEPCSPGSMAPNRGSASCDLCPAGFFQTSIGAIECLPCEPGSYADAAGLAQCSQCKPGSYQPNSSSSSPCERCPVGSYAEGAGAFRCEPCPSGMTTLLLGADSSALCTCPAGTFMREFQVESSESGRQVVQRECMRCNEYMEPCPGGTAPAYQKQGFQVTKDGQTVYQCMSTEACPGGLVESCPTGSSGPGCAECDDGSYYWDGNNCVECTAGNVLYLVFLPVIIIVLLVGTHKYGNDPIGRRHMSTISEMLVLGGLLLSFLFYFSSFQALDVEWKEPVATIMDIAQMFSTELANVDVSCSMTFGPAASLAFQSVVPLIFIVMSLPLIGTKMVSFKLLFNTFGSIVYAMYLLLVLHGLKPFRYIVHPMADRKSILFMPFIFEHSREHSRLIIVGVLVLLVYCVPFAAACGWASIAVMKRQPAQRRRLLAMFRFLFYKFRPRAFFWGFCILFRNIVVGVTPSIFPESPSAGLFVLSAVVIGSAVATGIVWPWRARWMNFADAGTLAYMALVLNLAVNWVRKDKDSDGTMATVLVVAAGVIVFVAAVFTLRLMMRLALSGAEARARMRAAALAEEEATEKELLAHLELYDPMVEVADGFDSLIRESFHSDFVIGDQPIAPALTWMSKQPFDIKQAANIAAQIRKKDYSLQHFFEDCASTFPELQLYVLSDGLPPADGRVIDLDIPEDQTGESSTTTNATSSSGRSGDVEKLRTFGALFTIYWICRLDMDGKQGLSFGVRPGNRHRVCEAPKKDDVDELLQQTPWGKMTPDQKRANFFHNFDWQLILDVFQNAGVMEKASNGQAHLDDGPDGRLVALLCLTAFHDIMKCSALCPRVVGEAYEGYGVGEMIRDHDHALAYILDRHAHLLPSFCSLSGKQRRWIRFTQSDMGFNAGWLVQAEGPPGIVLGKIKQAISSGRASDTDVAFYFTHYLTDLAGAEPTPFRGAEKFSVKFPPKVLQGLLGCISTVKKLAAESETKVYEAYLEKRWCEVSEQLGPVPKGLDRIAKLRLNCMAQHAAKPLLDALDRMDADDHHILTSELAETGVAGQVFSTMSTTSKPPAATASKEVSLPLLLYYGPAWCQRAGDRHPDLCLRVLAMVLRLARMTFAPKSGQDGQPESYTIQLAALRTVDMADLQSVLEDVLEGPSKTVGVLEMEKVNSIECKLVIQMTSA